MVEPEGWWDEAGGGGCWRNRQLRPRISALQYPVNDSKGSEQYTIGVSGRSLSQSTRETPLSMLPMSMVGFGRVRTRIW